jgi:molybdenum cofactor cytidylyltransferase
MGEPKQLMLLSGKTILEHSVDNLLSSRVSQVIVVLGYKAEIMAEKIGNRPVRTVINLDYQEGMSTSIAKFLADDLPKRGRRAGLRRSP